MNEEISHSEIIELTLEQESLILFERDKWQKIAYSTESIVRTKVTDTIDNAYKFIGKPIPKIIYRRQITFDREGRLQTKTTPAVQFPDGYCFYFYQNIPIPKKYGRKDPKTWPRSFLLKKQIIL